MALRFLTLLFMSLVCLLGGAASAGAAEDTLTLHDGKTVVGKIVKDEAETVTVQLPDGEQRAILKSKIAKIVRVGVPGGPAPSAIGGMKVVAPGSGGNAKDSKAAAGANGAGMAVPATGTGGTGGDSTALVNLIKTLSAPSPTQRRAAMDEIIGKKEQSVPVMLSLLNPKMNTDEYTRLGILRALVYCLPLSDQAAETIGYTALNDPYPEVRREACVTIRALSDDRSIRYILQQASTENVKMRAAVAAALHEIDDNRVLMGLIRALPQPTVNANYDEPKGLDKPAQYLPVGPGGATIPIFLPQGGVTGVAEDLDSPITHLLKQIAGKDMGNLHYGWFNWYREKLGESGQQDRESEREGRSMRDRMNR